MNEKAIPDAWIDRIFYRMAEIYGDRFFQIFKTLSYADLERTRWKNGLYGLSVSEIKKGIDVCLNNRYGSPPTVVEFFHYCKGYSSPHKRRVEPNTSSNTLTSEYIKELTGRLYGNTSC